MEACPLCSASMEEAEKRVRFTGEETEASITILVRMRWCPACEHYEVMD